ncbi:MAG: glycosyltransferase family 2 protein [Desulfuromonadaceae bacterium]|nr:glycosyltransferase family 2 protein [Desulfuromonadaceae bacterium]
MFSIIIPVNPGGHVAAIQHLKAIMPDDQSYEVLLAEGNAPSQQRNRAAQEAVGDILYFIDDDSRIAPENFALCAAGMSDPSVAVVGGPSITPAHDNWLQQLFGAALSSPFGSGPVLNRYRSHGETRVTTDKELILCNLAVRRSVFIDLGGFNECLYPNEENEFLERVTSAGYTLLHDPSMSVFRSQRPSLKAFVRQMFSYGRGRGQQTIVTSNCSVTSFIPLFFVIYLAVALVCIKYVLLLAPLMIYLAAALFSSLRIMIKSGRLSSLLLIGVYPLMHVVNGVGLLWGLMNGKPDPVCDSSILITKIKGLGMSFSSENRAI